MGGGGTPDSVTIFFGIFARTGVIFFPQKHALTLIRNVWLLIKINERYLYIHVLQRRHIFVIY